MNNILDGIEIEFEYKRVHESPLDRGYYYTIETAEEFIKKYFPAFQCDIQLVSTGIASGAVLIVEKEKYNIGHISSNGELFTSSNLENILMDIRLDHILTLTDFGNLIKGKGLYSKVIAGYSEETEGDKKWFSVTVNVLHNSQLKENLRFPYGKTKAYYLKEFKENGLL